jgi:hypothetical protein
VNWRREADGMVIQQAGSGTLTVLTISGDVETWDVGERDGVGWVKQDDGSLDVFFRASLMENFGEFDIIGSFGQGAWQCVRWESADGDTESEARP